MILRTCTLDDLHLLEEWDPTGEMWVGDKLDYLTKRANEYEYRMYIGETYSYFRNLPVAWGQIKHDTDKYEFILSWFVAPMSRRVGHGKELAKLLATMAGRPMRAKINANRPFSERLAISIGMVPESGLLETGEKWWIGR